MTEDYQAVCDVVKAAADDAKTIREIERRIDQEIPPVGAVIHVKRPSRYTGRDD